MSNGTSRKRRDTNTGKFVEPLTSVKEKAVKDSYLPKHIRDKFTVTTGKDGSITIRHKK